MPNETWPVIRVSTVHMTRSFGPPARGYIEVVVRRDTAPAFKKLRRNYKATDAQFYADLKTITESFHSSNRARELAAVVGSREDQFVRLMLQ